MEVADSVREKVEHFFATRPKNMDHSLGIELSYLSPEEVRGTMPVHPPTMQPFGFLHGGASVAFAETLASIGAWLNIDGENNFAFGMEINANHLRALRGGSVVEGSARPLHIGSTTHVWEISLREQGTDKLVCISRCTVAIRPKK